MFGFVPPPCGCHSAPRITLEYISAQYAEPYSYPGVVIPSSWALQIISSIRTEVVLVEITIFSSSSSTKSNVMSIFILDVSTRSKTKPKLYCSPSSALRLRLPVELSVAFN